MNRWSALILVVALLGGCWPFDSTGTRLAKVGKHTLTLEELQTSGIRTRDSVMHRVLQWVDQEIQVQEARALGIDRDPKVQWLLRDAERKILLDAYYARVQKEVTNPEEGELEIYFEKHKDEYLRNESWISIQMDSLGVDSLVVHSTRKAGYRSLFPSCLLGVLDTLQLGVSIPIIICDNTSLRITLIETRPQGGAMPFAEARSRVYTDVQALKRQQHLDSLLVDAKVRHTIFTWPENLPNPDKK